VDEGAAKLYMRLPAGISLSGSTVEVGMRVNVLKMSGRRNVTLRNFSVLRSRGGLQDTALLINASSNVVVENVQVRWHAYAGMGATSSSGVRITKSVFSDNGVYGTGCFKCLGIVLEDSEVARNNWRGYPAGHTGYDTVFKWGGSRDGVIRRSRFFDNLGGGIWFDGDNQRMLVEDSFSARNKTHGAFAEANGGPITIRRTKMCDNGTDGMMNARSNNVTLDANQIFNNAFWQIATTGNDTPLTVTDWQTGQTYVANSYNWTITNNTVVGRPLASGAVPSQCYPGPCGLTVWFRSQYDAIAQTLTSDYNRWFHTSTTKSFRVPDDKGMAVDQLSFRGLMSTMKINEMHSTWGDPGALSCTP
jgi:Right handed beta helix region